MKRFGYLAVLVMLLSSSADAGSISFMFHGHRVRVERPRHCFSRSCLSVTAPGLHGTHQDNGVDDIAAAPEAAPAKPATALPVLPPVPSPAPAPVQPVIASPTLAKSPTLANSPTLPNSPSVELTASPTQTVPPPRAESPKPSPVAQPPVTAQAAPAASSQQIASEPADTPLGDWQSEGNKGLVRIEPCGSALCGYMVDATTDAKGETILINMKPKLKSELKPEMKSEGATEWTGTIVSRASGSTYYSTMALKQSNTLRVEACVVGRFFCSGNDWSRIATNPQALITSRQATAQPPS
jgi:uncharacterized protein (DUF2147 family)